MEVFHATILALAFLATAVHAQRGLNEEHENLGRLIERGRFKDRKELQESLSRFLERERFDGHPRPEHFNDLKELVSLDRGLGRSFKHSKDKKELARLREKLRRYFDREFEKLRSFNAHHRRQDFDDRGEFTEIGEDLRSLLKGGRAKDKKELARIRENLGRFLEREHSNAHPGTDEDARVQAFLENFRSLLQRQRLNASPRSKRFGDREEFSKGQENLHLGLPKKGRRTARQPSVMAAEIPPVKVSNPFFITS
ncbi:hypothetical protein V3C99_010110 [Haemonchus contortus]